MSGLACAQADRAAAESRGQVYLVAAGKAEGDALVMDLCRIGFSISSFATADGFFASLPLLGSGCIVTEVVSGSVGGVALQSELRVRGCTFPVIAIVPAGDVAAAVWAMKAGAADVVVRPVGAAALYVALQGAQARLSHAAVDLNANRAFHDRIARLTRREGQVLDGLLQGAANKAIASSLGISPRTVEVHRAKVMEKLGCRSLPEVIRFAMRAGLAIA